MSVVRKSVRLCDICGEPDSREASLSIGDDHGRVDLCRIHERPVVDLLRLARDIAQGSRIPGQKLSWEDYMARARNRGE